MASISFARHFSAIADERQEGKVWHPLISVFFIAVASAIADCDDWEEAVCWAEQKIEWLRKFVDLPFGIPSISTFQRVFRMVDPEQFEKCFVGWARELAADEARRNVAIDGKTLRGAKEDAGGVSAVHIVSAYLSDSGLTLGEVKTDVKSNEKTAIPELLKILSISNSIVTIDAAGTYTDIASQIVQENKADYVLALKGNQPNMHKDAALFFTGVDLDKEQGADARIREAAARMPSLVAAAGKPGALGEDAPAFLGCDFESAQTLEKGHGRVDRRLYVLYSGDISWLSRSDEWEGLESIGMAVSISTNVKTGDTTSDARFFLCSISDVNEFASAVRGHWAIESAHWTLDVTFGEDKSRVRKDNEPQNLAMLRKLARNYLKVQKNKDLANEHAPGKIKRESFKVKRKRAIMSDEYLEMVMIGNFQ